MNIMQLAADLAQRVPEMAKDSTANNAEMIARLIGREAADIWGSPPEIVKEPCEIGLRDWFAGLAMKALLTNGFQPNSLRENYCNTADFNYFRASYAAADAMFSERKERAQ